MNAIDKDKKAVRTTLSSLRSSTPPFAPGQRVRLYGGDTIVTVVTVSAKTAMVRHGGDNKVRRALLKHLSIHMESELRWVGSLLAAQARYYKPGSVEAAIKSN